ncbi:CPXCG motif-containing cysteine-rich protein [Parahaliea mediterranea]
MDQQDAGDQYIEDCQVCCQPIVFTLMIDEAGEPTLTVQAENDV